MRTMIKDERSSPTSSSRDIRVQRIGDTLAEVRGLDGKLLGEWILDDDRSGPWRWVPMADAAPRDLPLMPTLSPLQRRRSASGSERTGIRGTREIACMANPSCRRVACEDQTRCLEAKRPLDTR